ncbi:MAG: ATP-dependent RecD-like DNA helicase [Clostridia bacterium]
MEEIFGIIESIKFRSEETGYTVCTVTVNNEEQTLVGKMPFIHIGEEIRANGVYANHSKFGKQFNVETFTKALPNTQSAILKYLSSGSIKGIGVVTASKIVDMFGDKTFETIENTPLELMKIKGINKEKAESISKIFKEQYGIRELLIFFTKFSISSNSVIKVWKRWGELATTVIKTNPYILMEEEIGISFDVCDELALSLGFEETDDKRIAAVIKHILLHNYNENGHIFLPKEKLVSTSADYIGTEKKTIEEMITKLIDTNELTERKISNHNAIYLTKMYQTEEYIAKQLLQKTSKSERFDVLDELIDRLENRYDIEYDKYQREGISSAVNNMVMVLTGGPGTGKTTTLKAIVGVFEEMGLKVILTAPTGRAAKRMQEICGCEAKTIHRLLEMTFTGDNTLKFGKDEQNKIDGEVIIIDEASMVDEGLFEGLLRATDVGTRLVIVGDADQLPSVGAGNILRDIIASEKVPSLKLDKIFRQANKSLIVTNSHKIIKGEYPKLGSTTSDFFFMPKTDENAVVQTVCDLVNRRLPNSYGYNPLNDIQVITPSKLTKVGTRNLNAVLRELLNPAVKTKKEKSLGRIIFREGDKVMQTKNNYDIPYEKDDGEEGIGVFNGDIGIIEKISVGEEKAYIRYDDKRAIYEFSDLKELDHAYAITVHKSQGSEFEAVIMPIFSGMNRLLYRNLLYTGVTRARKTLILVGLKEKIYQMVDNNVTSGRFTGLCEMLKEGK